ncbi:hypothetical protein D3C73_678970 [compost metagenome]|jgi:hypothetical protein
MRTLSGLPPARRLHAHHDEHDFDAARFAAGRDEAPPKPARPRGSSRHHGRGLDSWTILLIGAIAAGLMGLLLGGALSV